MFRVVVSLLVSAVLLSAAPNRSSRKDVLDRLDRSAQILNEVMAASDRAIPHDLVERAKCIAVIPGLKRAGFIVGAQYGKGVVVCRTAANRWSGPSAIRIEGGSFGAQIGAGETDLILVVMNDRGVQRLMESQFTMGGDVGVMAGPVGRVSRAETDALLGSEILAYGRSRGAFAGITVTGATFRVDNDDNTALYGRPVDHPQILRGKVAPPPDTRVFYNALLKYLPPGTAMGQ